MKKKYIFIILVALFAIGTVSNLFGGNDKKEDTPKQVKQEDSSNVKDDKKINIDYATINPSSKELYEALNQEFNTSEVKFNKDNKTLIVAINGESTWDGKHAAKQTALKGASIMKLLKDNKSIEDINIYYRMETIDDKGNKSMDDVIQTSFTRAIRDEIDFNNWHDLLIQKNFYTKFYTTADTFLIYPTIQNDLPKEDKDSIYIK